MSINAAKSAINRAIGNMKTCTIKKSGTKRGVIADTTSGNVFVFRTGFCKGVPTAATSFNIVFERGDGSWEGQLSDDYIAEDLSAAQQKVMTELINYIETYGNSVEITFED